MLGKTKIKYIQSLGYKKQRDEEGVFIAEGPKIVEELFRMNEVKVLHLYALPEWMDKNPAAKENATEITVNELAAISQLHTPNRVLAVISKFEKPVITSYGSSFTLALDTIQDPGNLGTIIRIADWFGISQIVCSADCADFYNPKVVQATMGSIGRVKIMYTDLAQWLKAQEGSRIYAAALEGEDVLTMKKPAGGIIVIGNESKGISPAVMEAVNVKITIPQKGRAESLNAAVATGIILSHLT